MATTLAQLLTEFYANGFDYLNDGGPGVTRATRWVNQAYQEVCDKENWPFLETTVTGTAPITIADLDSVNTVLDVTLGIKLEETDWRAMTEAYPNQNVSGTPEFWYLSLGTVVNVYPLNTTDTLSVMYYKNPSPLVNGTDTIVVPDIYADIVTLAACRRALMDDADAPDVGANRQEYEARLNDMRMSLLPLPRRQLISPWAAEDW